MIISLVLVVAVAILAVFFANYNQTVVQVNLFGYAAQGTLGLLIVIALGVGVLLGVLLMLPSVISRSWAVMRHRKKIEDLQNTLSNIEIIDDSQQE